MSFPETLSIEGANIALPDIADEELPNAPVVVICDDVEAVRLLVGRIAHHQGFITLMFDSADTAWQLIQGFNGKLDCLITDLHFPTSMTGMELAQRVKAQFPALPVCVMSGAFSQAANDALYNLGIQSIQKPFTAADIEQVLQRALSTSPNG